jgi:hypothetical protein
MPRPYSFDHFQARKPQQSVHGSVTRLGTHADMEKPVKSELPEVERDELPGEGGLHYGQEHAETVKRFQARRGARQQAGRGGQPAAKKKASPRKAAEKPGGTRRKTEEAAPASVTSTKQGIVSRPIRKAASTVKRLARAAAAAKLGRKGKTATSPTSKGKGPSKRR